MDGKKGQVNIALGKVRNGEAEDPGKRDRVGETGHGGQMYGEDGATLNKCGKVRGGRGQAQEKGGQLSPPDLCLSQAQKSHDL